MHLPNFSLFTIPQLIIHYQTFKRMLDEKKSQKKQLTSREKSTDTQIVNQLRLRINEIQHVQDKNLYMRTVFPVKAEVFYRSKLMGEGVVVGYENLDLKIRLSEKINGQTNIEEICVPYHLCHLKYVSYHTQT